MTLSTKLIETINAELAAADAQVVACASGHSFTRGELAAAFTRVQNADNWKLAIDTVVDIASTRDRLCIREAVIFFTGSVPTFTESLTIGRYRVRAAGYYQTIGA